MSYLLLNFSAPGLTDGMARCIKLCLSDFWVLQALCGSQKDHLLQDTWSISHDQGRYGSTHILVIIFWFVCMLVAIVFK